MKNIIELFSANLLNEQSKLNEIDYWLKVMDRPQGWHYDLDIIWILNELESNGIKKGSTILDAGAGLGVTQFILAARGYNIISLDFSKRVSPKLANKIFKIDIKPQDQLGYKHKYINYIQYGEDDFSLDNHDQNFSSKKNNYGIKIISFIRKNIKSILYFFNLKSRIKNGNTYTIYNWLESKKNHNSYGKITFLRGAFHKISILDESVDAIVSISALEHADKTLLFDNINEMKRVVKKNSPILITTSATDNTIDKYNEKRLDWWFSIGTLKKIAGKNAHINFDYKTALNQILTSRTWRYRIDPYYYLDSSCFLYKKRVNHIPFLPVGIKLFK